jgi:dCMP deaminase
MDKPAWNDWFMSLCLVIAQRSIDPSTKHGCIAIDKDCTILSIGYNGPPRDCEDNLIPKERPEKYDYFLHSEENAIINAARTGISLKDSIFYITGHPCHRCYAQMKSVGVSTIFYGEVGSQCLDTQLSLDKIKIMNARYNGPCLIPYKSSQNIIKILQESEKYLLKKLGV